MLHSTLDGHGIWKTIRKMTIHHSYRLLVSIYACTNIICLEATLFSDSNFLNASVVHYCKKDPSWCKSSINLQDIKIVKLMQDIIFQKCCDNNVQQCIKYGTCCIKTLWDTLGVRQRNTPDDIQSQITSVVNASNSARQKYLTCDDIFPLAPTIGHTSLSYFMVTSCLQSGNKMAGDKCYVNNIQDNLPVIGNDSIIYKNQKCARCNFVERFRLLDLNAYCVGQTSESNDTLTLSMMKRCFIGVNEKYDRRKCNKKVEERQKQCGRNNVFYKLCNSYTGQVYGHKNYHCWLCNNQTKYVDEKCPDGRKSFMLRWHFFMSFSTPRSEVTLAVPVANDEIWVRKFRGVCLQGEYPDFVTGKCVTYACPEGYDVLDYECVNMARSISNLYNSSYHKCLPSKYTKEVKEKVANMTKTEGNVSLNKLLAHSSTIGKTFSMIITSVSPVRSELVQKDFVVVFPEGMICSQPLKVDIDRNKSTVCLIDTISHKHLNKNMTMYISRSEQNKTRHIFFCGKTDQSPNCFLRNLLTNITSNFDRKIGENMSQSLIRPDNENNILSYYHVERYNSFGNSLGNCYGMHTPVLHLVEGYTSLVGTSISCCAHIATLATFKFRKENIPGFGLLTMCIFLLWSDVLFLMTSILRFAHIHVIRLICKSIAVLIHFGLLSVQLCAVDALWDLAVTVKTVRRRHVPFAGEYYRKRGFLISIPIMITALSFYVDQAGYGDNGRCIITGYKARVFFYIIPSAMSFFFIVLLITFTVYKLRKDTRERQSRLQNSGGARPDLVSTIGIKVVLVYGMAELVGFIQIPDGNNLTVGQQVFNGIFSVTYTVLRSFRGVMIFIVHVCSKQVWRAYKRYKRSSPNETVIDAVNHNAVNRNAVNHNAVNHIAVNHNSMIGVQGRNLPAVITKDIEEIELVTMNGEEQRLGSINSQVVWESSLQHDKGISTVQWNISRPRRISPVPENE